MALKTFNKEQCAFFALVRAGLWEQEIRLPASVSIEYGEIYRLAEEKDQGTL